MSKLEKQIAKAIKDNQSVRVELNYPHKFKHTIDYATFMVQVCEYLKRDNKLFNENIFRRACGEFIEEIK